MCGVATSFEGCAWCVHKRGGGLHSNFEFWENIDVLIIIEVLSSNKQYE